MRAILIAGVAAILYASASNDGLSRDYLESPLSPALCKNRVSIADFEGFTIPLGPVRLQVAQRIHCSTSRLSPYDEAEWIATLEPTASQGSAGDALSFSLWSTTPTALWVHAETFSILAISPSYDTPGQVRLRPVKIEVRNGHIEQRVIDVPSPSPPFPPAMIPYWGVGPASLPLSPLIEHIEPLRLAASPWLEFGEEVIIDMRTGATRRYTPESTAKLLRERVLGFAQDDRTLLSLAGTEDPRALRLVVTDTVADTSQVIPLDYPSYRVPRTSNGRVDFSAITPAWIHRHFDVTVRPGRALELRPRPERLASPALSFVGDYDGTTFALVCARPSIVPVMMEALRRDWSAEFDDQPYTLGGRIDTSISCAQDAFVERERKTSVWSARVGVAKFELTLEDDDSVNLQFLGPTDRPSTHVLLSAPAEAMARATFDAVIGYLNDRLQDPAWRAHLTAN